MKSAKKTGQSTDREPRNNKKLRNEEGTGNLPTITSRKKKTMFFSKNLDIM
jgi:hypothetical protein